jgi:hypothetical protein
VARTVPSGRIGTLTIDRSRLPPSHPAAVDIDAATPIEDAGDGHLAAVFLGDASVLDAELATRELIEAGRRLLARDPRLGAIVLECANLPPYASALQRALGIPVYDWYSMVTGFVGGLAPRPFFAPSLTTCTDPEAPATCFATRTFPP